jgi:glycosyltransferase involved in cell wall biosynthesis
MTRIAIPSIGGPGWMGGRNYLLNLLQSVVELGSGAVEPVLCVGVVGGDHLIEAASAIGGVTIICDPVFNAANNGTRLRRALLTGCDDAAASLFRANAIDCVFEPARYYGWRFPLPALAWIPDFQHRHMPELFSHSGWWKRDLGFRAQVISGRHFMLSSEDARTDCERFYPATKGRTSVVKFAVPLPAAIGEPALKAIRDQYDLPETYYFLPNQFWRHKNHSVVIEALALLKSSGSDVCVVTTGHTADPRDPGYFDRVSARVADAGINDQFRILGSVPYADVGALMQGCAALINPSKFEGWSTTVEEAKALGIRMILSDLRVHREQAQGAADFFAADDAVALSNIMTNFQVHAPASRGELVQLAHDRRRDFVQAFEAAVGESLRTAGS